MKNKAQWLPNFTKTNHKAEPWGYYLKQHQMCHHKLHNTASNIQHETSVDGFRPIIISTSADILHDLILSWVRTISVVKLGLN